MRNNKPAQYPAKNAMKIATTIIMPALAIALTSCVTSKAPQGSHNPEVNAVGMISLDDKAGAALKPETPAANKDEVILANVISASQQLKAGTPTRNRNESQIGLQYHIRGTMWFVGLQGLANEHDVPIQGNTASAEGLITLTKFF